MWKKHWLNREEYAAAEKEKFKVQMPTAKTQKKKNTSLNKTKGSIQNLLKILNISKCFQRFIKS